MAEAAEPLDNKVSAGTDSAARRYVNHIDLSFSLSEVRIDLGQDFAELRPPSPQCRLVTSPVHLRRMEQEISQTITRYENRFGAIPTSESASEEAGEANG